MRFTLALIALAAALPLVSPSIQAQERREIPAYREIGVDPGSSVDMELEAFLRAYRDAWGAEDTDALMALHVQDTEWINAYARIFTHSAALAGFLETRLFPAFGPDVARREIENMHLISMRAIGTEAAVLHLFTDSPRGASGIEGQDLRRTHFHLVLTRESGGWKVAHTVIMDARE